MSSRMYRVCFSRPVACLGLFCLSLSGCSAPLAPIIKHTGDSYVRDVVYVPESEKCIFVESEKVVVYEKNGSTPVAKSDPLLDWFNNGYQFGTYSKQLGLLIVGKDNEGIDFLDPETLTKTDGAPKPTAAHFYYPIPETSSSLTMLDDYTLARVDQKTLEVEWKVKTRIDSIYCAHAVSSNWIAMGEREGIAGRVKLYNIKNGETSEAVLEHTKQVRGLSISQDETLIASSGDDGFLRVYDTASREVIWEQMNDVDGAFANSIHPNNDYIAVGCMRGIKIWSLKTRKLISSWNAHSWFVQCIQFSKDGELLLSGSADKTGAMWRTSDLIGRQTYVKSF